MNTWIVVLGTLCNVLNETKKQKQASHFKDNPIQSEICELSIEESVNPLTRSQLLTYS